jgi:hypothetical protein
LFMPSLHYLALISSSLYGNARANGLRYPLVGGLRQRHFIGTNVKPRKLPENAATPTSRVHAVLARFFPFTLSY